MGFVPDITHEANNVHSILRLVQHGAGISILPSIVKNQFPELKLRYIPLAGSSITTEVVLAKKVRDNEAINWFTERYKRYFIADK